MPAAGAYRSRRSDRSQQTRERIMGAVRELLAEGTFHEAPVEEVAERAGVSRATLYQHFRSRVDLVDAICETFAANRALRELREAVELDDPDEALAETVALATAFWASEDAVLGELYGVAAIDPAAQALVERQRADRHGEMARLARRLSSAGRLRAGIGERRALQLLMVLTSYETFRELRLAGTAERDLAKTLQASARTLLLGG
jgi:AcrR family transcriptional regulator